MMQTSGTRYKSELPFLPFHTPQRTMVDEVEEEEEDDILLTEMGNQDMESENTNNYERTRADFWIPQATPDGRLFYFNTETGESSMELPELLSSPTENESQDRMNVNIPDKTRPLPEMFLRGFMQEEDDECDGNSTSELEGEDFMMSSEVRTNGRTRALKDFDEETVLTGKRRRLITKFFMSSSSSDALGDSGTTKGQIYRQERRRKQVKQLGSAPTTVARMGMNNFRQPSNISTENWRKVLRILIKTKEHIACPDSGSEKNIMSESLAVEHNLEIRRRPRDIKKFELGSGKLVSSTGRVRVNVQVPGLPLRRNKRWFYVFKSCPVPLVLGMKFLAEAKILTQNRHLLETCPPNLSNVSSLFWIGSPRNETSTTKQPRNRLKCWLDGRCVVAVADTGSDLNMMCPKCAEREGFPIDTRPDAKSLLQFGDGTLGATMGQVYIYNLTLDWRSPETKIIPDVPVKVRSQESQETVPAPEQQNHDEKEDTDGSTSGAVFHVLEGLPCDVILGRDLLEKTNAFTFCPGLLSSKSRDRRKPFECKVLISLGPLSRRLPWFRSKEQSNAPAPNSKEAHDNERHVEMFRRSEKETEIALLPVAQRAQEEAKESRRVRHWNAVHVNCVHCSPV